MIKTRLFGTIIALTLAIIPTTDFALSNKMTIPITASAAYTQAGVYQATKATKNVYLNNPSKYGDYCLGISPANDINLVKGAYVYSDGWFVCGPELNGDYYVPYLRISVGGKGYWVPMDNFKLYRAN